MLLIYYPAKYKRYSVVPAYLFKISNKMCKLSFYRQLMTSQTLRFIFNHPLKQWPTGKKGGRQKYKDLNILRTRKVF